MGPTGVDARCIEVVELSSDVEMKVSVRRAVYGDCEIEVLGRNG